MKKPSSLPLRIAKLFTILLIMLTFLVLFVFCVFLPRTKISNYDNMVERPKLSFKGLLDGSYTEQYADWFGDTVHKRDWFKEQYATLESWFGADFNETKVWGKPIDLDNPPDDPDYPDDPDDPSSDIPIDVSGGVSQTTSAGTPTSDPGPETSTDTPPEVVGAKEIGDSLVMVGNERVLEMYYADRKLSRIPQFTETLNQFADAMPNIHVYSMVIPKPAAYYLQNVPEYAGVVGYTLQDLQAIEERLSDKVQSINVYDALKEHTEEHIYFHTDHHWTALGAYYGVQKFASDLELPFADLSTYTLENRQDFLGSMYTYTDRDPEVAKLAEEFSIYRPNFSYQAQYYDQSFQNPVSHDIFFSLSDDHRSLWYMTFINGDANAWKIHSDACSNGRKLLLVKDSYGNAMVPFLLSSFEEVYVVDARQFQRNLKEFVNEQGITDVLFAECAFSATGKAYINKLKGITQ